MRLGSQNPERDAAIIAMRRVGHKTHKQIATAFNLTPARIRQIIYRQNLLDRLERKGGGNAR